MSSPLQFEQAEFEKPPAAAACASCQKPIAETYFEVNGQVACEACKVAAETRPSGAGRFGRFFLASLFGSIGGAVGAAVWYAVQALTGWQLGLIAIVVGVLVGSGVKMGCQGRGGWFYQLLAVFITYAAIVSTYVPELLPVLREKAGADGHGVVLVFFAFALSFVVPFMGGLENAIGIVIIGIALWEAWKINRRPVAVVSGPYRVAPAAPPAEDVAEEPAARTGSHG